jgi:hypothetical protein
MCAAVDAPVCPHCGSRLALWTPPESSSWSHDQRVCVDDECPYYVRGWQWMEERFGVHASYRYRQDAVTGRSGPFPVNTPEALKDAVTFPEEDAG